MAGNPHAAAIASTAVPTAPEPLLELPGGFPPDAVGFALRTTLAVLLAYYLAFRMQLATASSAGLCVAIVAQPGHGATVSKSVYRFAGTVIGGTIAVAAMAAFPQDRTMLLAAFVLWMGICTFAASLLKDFGAYGAALAGYTFGIVALTDIDAPHATFLAALNRVAAILLGIFCAALVNGILTRPAALQELAVRLQAAMDRTIESATTALRGDATPVTGIAAAEQAAAILALRTQAGYVATELQDGSIRAAGARSAIVALLGMLSLARLIALGRNRGAPDAQTGLVIDRAVALLRQPGDAPTELASAPAGMHDTFLSVCADRLLEQHRLALDGFASLRTGRRPAELVWLKVHHDVPGAVLNGVRAAISTALAAAFCVYGGWSGATLMLIQISAYAALLGRLPQPTRATLLLCMIAPLPIFAAWVVKFLLLPQGSSFLLFALAVAPFALFAAAASRHPRISAAGNVMLVTFLLVLTPTNPESYDLTAFLNTAACLFGSMLAMLSGFVAILPVSPSRRRFRLFQAVVRSLRRTLRGRRRFDLPTVLSLQSDRLANALPWLGRRTPARLSLLVRLGDLVGLDATLCRAHVTLDAAMQEGPALAAEAARARAALLHPVADGVAEAAAALLAAARQATPDSPAGIRAAANLYAVSLLLERQCRLLERLGLPGRM